MENRPMYPLALYLANDARDRDIRDAARARRVPRQPSRSIRQAVGQSIARFGARMAGEQYPGLARSR